MKGMKGFTLVELVVVMAIFMGIMIISTYAFENILRTAGQQVKSAETQTEGIVGLEMLRGDLEHAGFGLPWTVNAVFTEMSDPGDYPVTGISASFYNETTPSAIRVDTTPAAGKILDGSSTTNPLVAYLVIKGTNVTLNDIPTAPVPEKRKDPGKKWTYVNYSGSSKSYLRRWPSPSAAEENFAGGESVITLSLTADPPNRTLVTNGAQFYYTMPASLVPPAAFQPGDASESYLVYGVDRENAPRMPYNRTDYYVRRPADAKLIPAGCNSGTGILYKGVVQHADANGAFAEYPLLNCVGDMQVEFELVDPTNPGSMSYLPTLAGLTPADIRQQVKAVRVYVLAHEGKKDPNYTYPTDTIQVGDTYRANSSGRTWNGSAACAGNSCMQTVFGSDWRNYRWKVFTMVGRPKF